MASSFMFKKLDFIEENRMFLLDKISIKIYNIYRVKEQEVIKMDDETCEWIRWLISTAIELFGLWLAWKSQKKPSHRKLRKKHKR